MRNDFRAALRGAAELAVLAFFVSMVFGCTAAPSPQTQQKLEAAELVAFTSCYVRQASPVVTEVMHQAVSSFLPGGEAVHDVIQASCALILSEPPNVLARSKP